MRRVSVPALKISMDKEYGYLKNEAYWTAVSSSIDIFKAGTETLLMGARGVAVKDAKERREWEKHEIFINKLLKKFPELKYIEVNNIFYDDATLADAHRSQL